MICTTSDDRLERLVSGPPVRKYRGEGAAMVEEAQVLVGNVDAPEEQRDLLESYGIYMDLAEFDPDSGRWERCLFSEEVADMLAELHEEDQFPYLFEAGPSRGELAWLRAQAAGASERPKLPLRAYIVAAPSEALAELALSA